MGNIISFICSVAALPIGFQLGTSIYMFSKEKKEIEENKYNEEHFEFPDRGDECILLVCIRHDLQMQKGKVAAHCDNASVAAYVKGMKFDPKMVKRWMRFGRTKITLKVDTEEDLIKLEETAKSFNILTSVMRDAEQAEVAPGSRTVIAIGPAPERLLDNVTRHLKLY